jgi:methylmalonyl-CoA/ethylmalonyl-CoA epimerase
MSEAPGRAVGPIHHVGIVVRSIDEALPRYAALFALAPEREPFIFAAQRVRLAFLPTGPAPAASLELVEPIDDESGVARFLEARGEGVHHVCFASTDLVADIAALSAHGAELIDDEPRAGAHGTVAFIHPRTLSGVLWELLEVPDADERA